MLSVVLMLAIPCGAELTLPEIEEAVRRNFERIETFRAVVEVDLPSHTRRAGEIGITYDWAFRKDGRVRIETRPLYREGVAPPPDGGTIHLRVFDGTTAKHVTLDAHGNQLKGSITSPGQIRSNFFAEESTGYGRMFGHPLGGRLLPDWLAADDAEILDVRSVGETPCVAVASGRYRLYLAVEKRFALRRWERLTERGTVGLSLDNQAFSEIEEGLWFPMRGVLEWGPFRPGYRVKELTVNEDFPEGFFTLRFLDGLTVVDGRFRTSAGPVVYAWDEAIHARVLKMESPKQLLDAAIPIVSPSREILASPPKPKPAPPYPPSPPSRVDPSENESPWRARMATLVCVSIAVLCGVIAAIEAAMLIRWRRRNRRQSDAKFDNSRP